MNEESRYLCYHGALAGYWYKRGIWQEVVSHLPSLYAEADRLGWYDHGLPQGQPRTSRPHVDEYPDPVERVERWLHTVPDLLEKDRSAFLLDVQMLCLEVRLHRHERDVWQATYQMPHPVVPVEVRADD